MILAVLTGDIVDSSALPPEALDATLAAIEAAAQDCSGWTSPHSETGFARRGGDAWQMALGDTRYSLRAALYIRATLRRLDGTRTTRIAIAEGDGTMPPDGNTNTAHGPAFTDSGRLLEALPKHVLMSHATPQKAATLHLADHIARGWTEAQAASLCEMLPPDPGPRTKAADRLGISRQAVDQALWAAGYPALDAALAAWEGA